MLVVPKLQLPARKNISSRSSSEEWQIFPLAQLSQVSELYFSRDNEISPNEKSPKKESPKKESPKKESPKKESPIMTSPTLEKS